MQPKPQAKASSVEVLITVRDAAVRSSCSEKTMRRAIALGHLDAIKIGPGERLLRIHPSALEAYWRSRRL